MYDTYVFPLFRTYIIVEHAILLDRIAVVLNALVSVIEITIASMIFVSFFIFKIHFRLKKVNYPAFCDCRHRCNCLLFDISEESMRFELFQRLINDTDLVDQPNEKFVLYEEIWLYDIVWVMNMCFYMLHAPSANKRQRIVRTNSNDHQVIQNELFCLKNQNIYCYSNNHRIKLCIRSIQFSYDQMDRNQKCNALWFQKRNWVSWMFIFS